MMRAIYLVRFFRAVPPGPPLMGIAFTIATAMAATSVLTDPDSARRALTPLLLLQLFACSSGFMIPARRGHYDLLLTSGESRLTIASVHWMMSLLPGVSGWLIVSVVETLVRRGAPATAMASGSVLAWVLVSTLPWAATVALPRFAAAITWLVVLVTMLTTLPSGQATLVAALDDGAAPAWAAVAALVYPMGLLGRTLSPSQWAVVAPALVLSVVARAVAFVWFTRADIPLEASQ